LNCLAVAQSIQVNDFKAFGVFGPIIHSYFNLICNKITKEDQDMEKLLGIVQDDRFSVLLPRSQCCTVKLTRIARPASIADELAASHEIDLAELEGRAIMVTGVLPERKGWLYEANVIDQAGPILTEVVKETFHSG
jgi:hypothetical protein